MHDLLLALGLLMLLGGAIAGLWIYRFRKSAEQSAGTVIRNQESFDSGGISYRPEVEFVASDGRRHTFVGQVGSSPPAFKVGDSVVVLYARDRPENARIDTFVQQWLAPSILVVLGLILTLAGVIPLLTQYEKLGF